MESGLSAITDVMTFLTGNDVFKVLIWVAVAGVVISAVMSIFFRR